MSAEQSLAERQNWQQIQGRRKLRERRPPQSQQFLLLFFSSLSPLLARPMALVACDKKLKYRNVQPKTPKRDKKGLAIRRLRNGENTQSPSSHALSLTYMSSCLPPACRLLCDMLWLQTSCQDKTLRIRPLPVSQKHATAMLCCAVLCCTVLYCSSFTCKCPPAQVPPLHRHRVCSRGCRPKEAIRGRDFSLYFVRRTCALCCWAGCGCGQYVLVEEAAFVPSPLIKSRERALYAVCRRGERETVQVRHSRCLKCYSFF